MTNQTDDLLPEGLADRLPAAAAKTTRAMRAALEVLGSHGYDRVQPPLVEFERSLAGRMDGLDPLGMIRFVDPVSLRNMAVRSDMTVQVGRIAATSLSAAPRPLRLCYSGDVATLTADQLNPARQRLQLGAELVGSDGVAAASEIVMLAIEAVRSTGAPGISVDFTLPDLVETLSAKAMPLDEGQKAKIRKELDTKDAGGLKQAGGDAYLPLLYATGDFFEAIERLSDIDAGGALATRIDGLKQIAATVGDKARITLDPTERHGFEYQSWFGFTIYAEGARGALGRGGTYAIKGVNEAATGFSLYIDTLAAILPDEEPAQTLYLPLGHDTNAAARLRAIGWRTIAALSNDEDAATLGCTHRLDGAEAVPL